MQCALSIIGLTFMNGFLYVWNFQVQHPCLMFPREGKNRIRTLQQSEIDLTVISWIIGNVLVSNHDEFW